MSLWVYDGAANYTLFADSGGYNYNSETTDVKQSSLYVAQSLDCISRPWQTRVRGREWDDDSSEYYSNPDYNSVAGYCG